MDTQALSPIFISHGSPMTALEPREAGAFMQQLGQVLQRTQGRPKAVLAISAHSLTREPVLLAAPRHEAVYDFGGFDPRLYTLRYDAAGAPQLAERVAALLSGAGIAVHHVAEGGLDHGIWVPLRFVFEDAGVPVLPLAWPPQWSAEQLFALGRALTPLADEGVLIVGSGSITHNLRRVFAGGGMHPPERPATPESSAFRAWFAERGAAADWPALLDWKARAPFATLMHPTDEHLLPFFVAAGAGGQTPALRIHDSLVFGDLGMDAYAFGPAAPALQAALQA
jgi:4,5-DOPA dioxygenase extradiol